MEDSCGFGIPGGILLIVVLGIVRLLVGASKKTANHSMPSAGTETMLKLVFNGTEIFFHDSSYTELVTRMGNFFVREGMADGQAKSFKLIRRENNFDLHMVIEAGMATNTQVIQFTKWMAAKLSNDVFDGTLVDIHLCDEWFNLLRVVGVDLEAVNLVAADATWNRTEISNTKLLTHASITQEESNRFVEYLLESGFINGSDNSVELTKTVNGFLVRFMVQLSFLQNLDIPTIVEQFRIELSQRVFVGARVDVHLCDELGKTSLSFEGPPILGTDQRITIGNTSLFYSSSISLDEASRLSDFLTRQGFAENQSQVLRLHKADSIYHFQWVFPAGSENIPRLVREMEEYAFALSKEVFQNSNVRVHFCDEKFQTRLAVGMAKQLQPECPHCAAVNVVPTESVSEQGLRTKCAQCSKEFVVTPSSVETVDFTYSPQVDETKACPMCAETVKAKAKICRYCRYEFQA